jgi:hypothetical protein
MRNAQVGSEQNEFRAQSMTHIHMRIMIMIM